MKKDFLDTYNKAMLEEDKRYGNIKKKKFQYYKKAMENTSKEILNDWEIIQDKYYNGEIDAYKLGIEKIRLFGDWKE